MSTKITSTKRLTKFNSTELYCEDCGKRFELKYDVYNRHTCCGIVYQTDLRNKDLLIFRPVAEGTPR